MRFKKVIAAVAASLVLGTAFSGCGGGSGGEKQAAKADDNSLVIYRIHLLSSTLLSRSLRKRAV